MADPRVVTSIIQAWDSLMRFISPSVVVGDFAPGAMIAANGRCPTIAVGNGFTVPAVVNGRFLPFQEQRGTDIPVQERVKAAVSEAKKRAGHRIPDDPLIAIRGEIPLPSCYKSFDVARGRRIEPLLPPDIQHFEVPSGRPPAGIGAYFGPDIGTYAHLLQLFGALRPKPVIALEGAEANIRKAVSRAGLLTRNTLFSLQDIARGCRVFLHHGGLGIAQLCALVGVPQLIIFCDTEKWMNAEAVKEQGAGIGIPLETADRANIEGALNALLNEPRFKKAALAWSEMLKSERGTGPTAATICDSICGAV
jgi:UDP:flavonoid glycosyltransferase YjiC (YdhE family)